MGGCNFRNILTIIVPKKWRGNSSFLTRIFHQRHCGSLEYAHSREKQTQRNLHNSKGFSQNAKVVIMLANDTSGLAFCSPDLGYSFENNVGLDFGVPMMGKGPHEPEFAYDIAHIHSPMIYSDLVEYNIVGDTKAPLL